MTPAKPLPRLVPVTSTSEPAGICSTVISWPTSKPSTVVEAEFDQALARGDARLGVLAGVGTVELLRILLAVGDLEGGVAVAFGGHDLHDAHRLDSQDGDRNDLVVHPRLSHADFLADDRLLCHGGGSS